MNEYSLYLQTHIKPWCKEASGGRVVNCRCFYCSDSRNMNHGHFYISIPEKDDEPSLYYCQKCKVGGIVTPDKLIEWNIFDSDISLELSSRNKKATVNPRNSKYFLGEKANISNDKITDDDLSRVKLSYINNRLGSNLSYMDCLSLKIVLNLNDLLSRNPYLKYTRDPRIIEALDSAFVGFLSYDNAFLNMRKISNKIQLHKSIDKRYVNYNITGKYDNTCRFYTIPTSIDFTKTIELHVAEGPFDILGIYLNTDCNKYNSIFSSVGGSGYKGLIRYFISILKSPNIIIHVYPDNDQNRYSIIDIAEYLKPFGYHFYIHRNIYPGEKDFGVPRDRIQEVIERVEN